MTSRYESLSQATLYPDAFGVAAPPMVPTPSSVAGGDVWPRRPGVFIRLVAGLDAPPAGSEQPSESPGEQVVQAVQALRAERAEAMELVGGQFGLVPPGVKSASDGNLRATKQVVSRSETVTTSNITRHAWLGGQRCIVPVMAFFEDDWRTGKAVSTRIARVDGKPMGLAGLWERWEKDGEVIDSYTLLTINANSHALMHRYQTPGVEKRMPAVLNEGAYKAWLNARPEKAREFLRAYPANWLLANPVEKKGKKPRL